MKYKINKHGEIIKNNDNNTENTLSNKSENAITAIFVIVFYWVFYYVYHLIWGLGLTSVTVISGIGVFSFFSRIFDNEDEESWKDVSIGGKIFILISFSVHSYILFLRFTNPNIISNFISNL